MGGTRIENLKLIKVVDGDTVKVEMGGKVESLRLLCLDTEESLAGSNKPVTNAGKLASQWAKDFFGVDAEGFPSAEIRIDIEFDTGDPEAVSLVKHRDNYGRLLCYVYREQKNFAVSAIQEGWSPYFVKYGRSRLYHGELLAAEAQAQSQRLAVWNPATNANGARRDYDALIPWWHQRDAVVQDYRLFGLAAGVRSVRLDYDEVLDAARAGRAMTLLCDLQSGVNQWTGNGALIYGGSPQHKFNLWIPDRDSASAQRLLALIQIRYAGDRKRNYVYVTGTLQLYQDKPEIVLTDIAQLMDIPAKTSLADAS